MPDLSEGVVGDYLRVKAVQMDLDLQVSEAEYANSSLGSRRMPLQ